MVKKYFYFALAGVFIIIFALIFYGAYINYSDEETILESIATHNSIPIKGAKATVRKINPRLDIDVVDLFSNERTDAVAMIDGRISSVNVKKNDSVTAGQTLFVLKNDQYPIRIRQADIDILKAEGEILKADNDIVKAETLLANAKHDLERYTRLRDKEAVSVGKFEQIEMAFKEAQINLQSLRLQKQQVIAQRDSLKAQKEQILVESSYSNVTAPIDGEILILYKKLGSFVTQGTALALIGDFSDLFFEMTGEDKLIRQLSTGQKVQFFFRPKSLQKVYGTEYRPGNTGHAEIFDGYIVEISPALDQPSAIRKIIWRIDNRSGILEPRTYSDVICQSVVPRRCLTVPLTAVNNQKDALFVFSDDGTIKKIHVTTGVSDTQFIEVIEGLKENDVVASEYGDNLIEGMYAEAIFEEGEHVAK